MAESIDLTDLVLRLPPPALSFSTYASPLGYRPHSVPLSHPPALFERVTWLLSATISIGRPSQHQYIRYIDFSFLPSSPLLRLSPPPQRLRVPSPHVASHTFDWLTRRVCGLIGHHFRHRYPLPNGTSLPSHVISPPVSTTPVYCPIAWSLWPRFHPPANCDADISGTFVPPSILVSPSLQPSRDDDASCSFLRVTSHTFSQLIIPPQAGPHFPRTLSVHR